MNCSQEHKYWKTPISKNMENLSIMNNQFCIYLFVPISKVSFNKGRWQDLKEPFYVAVYERLP